MTLYNLFFSPQARKFKDLHQYFSTLLNIIIIWKIQYQCSVHMPDGPDLIPLVWGESRHPIPIWFTVQPGLNTTDVHLTVNLLTLHKPPTALTTLDTLYIKDGTVTLPQVFSLTLSHNCGEKVMKVEWVHLRTFITSILASEWTESNLSLRYKTAHQIWVKSVERDWFHFFGQGEDRAWI